MKHLIAVAFIATAFPAYATDVGVSISVGQPGFYGRLDIGNFPQPALIYPQPLVIYPPAVGVVAAPVYLHVPPGHAKNWKKYCHKYDGCHRPVYFVHERWYNEVYVPNYNKGYQGSDGQPGKGHGKGQGKGSGKN